jgi:pimeloyl-ACP methyl ester carboxylesterase
VLVEPVFLAPSILEAVSQIPDAATNNPYVNAARNRRNNWLDKQEAFAHYRQKPVFARFSDESLWDYVQGNIISNEDGRVTLRYSREWEARLYTLLLQKGGLVWEALPGVKQPTLAIRATQTDTLFEEAWQLWQEQQPGAAFVEVPDASHMLVMERPSEIAQLILHYLEASHE